MRSILFRVPADVKAMIVNRAEAGAMTIATYIRRLVYKDLKLPQRDAVMKPGRGQKHGVPNVR